jgi:hypothetical protein
MKPRGLYELLQTKALADLLTQPPANLEPVSEPLRSAEAADRISLHLGRAVQEALDNGRRRLVLDFVENARARIVEDGLAGESELNDLTAALGSHLDDAGTLVVSSLFLQVWGGSRSRRRTRRRGRPREPEPEMRRRTPTREAAAQALSTSTLEPRCGEPGSVPRAYGGAGLLYALVIL